MLAVYVMRVVKELDVGDQVDLALFGEKTTENTRYW